MKYSACYLACMVAGLIAPVAQAAGPVPNVISPSSAGNTGAAPIGIAATPTQLLYTQPFCPGVQTRGIYSANPLNGASSLLTPLTSANTNLAACAENYLVIATGGNGFTAGDTFTTAASPTTSGQDAVLRNGTLFIDHIPAPTYHSGITFDTAGTFGGALIVLANGAVMGFNSSGALLFTYPAPANYVLEGGAVAPLSYAPCPGCLYITAELKTDVNNPNPTGPGAIFRVLPGTPSGTPISLVTYTPGIVEPEGLQFVTNNALACSNGGYDYFVTSYASGGQYGASNSTSGSILEFTPAQLTPFVGDFLVPNETNSTIYAFNAAGTPTVFFSAASPTAYQFEGSSILQCATHGCPATFGFWKHHPFPAAMFSGGYANIGCHLYSASDLLAILDKNNAGGNAVTILGHQLIAAIANYMAGGKQTPAATAAIGQAIALLCANNINMSTSFVQAGSSLGQLMTNLANTLDAYNSSAPSCEGQF